MYAIWTGSVTGNPGSPQYAFVTGNYSMSWNTWEISGSNGNSVMPLSDACSIVNFTVTLSVAPGTGNSRTFAVRNTGSTTAVSVTISGAATTATWTGKVDFAQLALVSVQATQSGSPASLGTANWTIGYQTPGNYYLMPSGSGNYVPGSSGVNYYSPIMGGNFLSPDATAATYQSVAPTSFTVTKIAGYTSVSGGNYTFNVYKNNTSTASSFSAVVSGTTGISSAGTMAFSPGDFITMRETLSGTWSQASSCITIVPSIAGEICLMYGTLAQPSATATSYEQLWGAGNNSWGATESASQVLVAAGVYKKLYVSLDTTPGSGKSRSFTLRSAAASATLTCTVSNTATTANDTTHSVPVNPGTLMDMMTVPASTPAATGVRFGLVQVVPQPSDFFSAVRA